MSPSRWLDVCWFVAGNEGIRYHLSYIYIYIYISIYLLVNKQIDSESSNSISTYIYMETL